MDLFKVFSASARSERSGDGQIMYNDEHEAERTEGVTSVNLEKSPDGKVTDNEVREILRGAIDLHVHPGPSPFPRRIGLLEAARQAADAGFAAIVAKSHHHSMVTDILALQDGELSKVQIQVFSGIALNDQVGGLNPYAVELCLRMGGKIVWFPTISSHSHLDHHHTARISNFPTSTISLRENTPISIIDENGDLKPEVLDIIDLIAEERSVLTGGHLDASHIDILFKAARNAGVAKLLVNHPNFIVGATPALCAEWARDGVYVEHSLCMYDKNASSYKWDISKLLEYVEAAGPDHTILASDLGQRNNPLPVNAYESVLRELLDAGVSKKELQMMTVANPAHMIFD